MRSLKKRQGTTSVVPQAEQIKRSGFSPGGLRFGPFANKRPLTASCFEVPGFAVLCIRARLQPCRKSTKINVGFSPCVIATGLSKPLLKHVKSNRGYSQPHPRLQMIVPGAAAPGPGVPTDTSSSVGGESPRLRAPGKPRTLWRASTVSPAPGTRQNSPRSTCITALIYSDSSESSPYRSANTGRLMGSNRSRGAN
jgi:hypothetical protein